MRTSLAQTNTDDTNSILQFMSDAVIKTDGNWHVTFWNRAAESLYGWTANEAMGQQLNALLKTKWPDTTTATIETTLTQTNTWRGELQQQTKAAQTLCIETAISRTDAKAGHTSGYLLVNRDATQRKQAEEALRQQEAYLHSLLESQTAFIIRTDLEGQITYVNQRFANAYQEMFPKLIGMLSLETTVPDDREKATDAARRCLENPGQSVQVVLRKPDIDGGYFWTLWEFVTVTNRDGVVNEIQCVGFDITEHMKAEEALRQSAARQQALLTALPDLLFRIRSDGLFLDFHSPHPDMLAMPPSQFMGKKIADVVPPDMAQTFMSVIKQVISKGEPMQVEYSMTVATGRREFEARIVPTNPTEVMALVSDITEKRQSQRVINLHNIALEAASNAIVITNQAGIIEWINPAFTTLTGYTFQEAQGKTMKLLKSDVHDAAFYQDLWQTITSGQVWQEQLTNKRKDGSLYIEEQTITPVYDYTGNISHFIAIKQDVTEREYNEQLRLEQERLRANLKKEQEFSALVQKAVSSLSHDIRNPLTVISNARQMLSKYFDRLDEEKRREKLDLIGKQLHYVLELLDDMTLVVKGSLNQSAWRPVLVNLPVLCQASIDQIQETMGGNHRFRLVVNGRIQHATLDETLVSRILLNLLSNAVKFSPENSEICLEVSQTEESLVLRVADRGIGIEAADLPHIYDPFYRAEQVRYIGGTGLGLNIVKECVERHNGRIAVDSHPGRGTTFTVELPLNIPEKEADT